MRKTTRNKIFIRTKPIWSPILNLGNYACSHCSRLWYNNRTVYYIDFRNNNIWQFGDGSLDNMARECSSLRFVWNKGAIWPPKESETEWMCVGLKSRCQMMIYVLTNIRPDVGHFLFSRRYNMLAVRLRSCWLHSAGVDYYWFSQLAFACYRLPTNYCFYSLTAMHDEQTPEMTMSRYCIEKLHLCSNRNFKNQQIFFFSLTHEILLSLRP